MKKVYFLYLLLLSSFTIYSQTGPGGIGNSDGSNGQPENVIWFIADSLSLSDTDPVTTWTDESGNGNDATQAIAGSQPTYRTGQINGLPAVVFDGTEDYMPFDGSLIANSDYTVIFVGGRQTNSAMKVFLGGTTSSANQNLHLYWFNSAQFRAHHYGNDLQTDMVANTETYSGGTDATEYGIFSTLLSSTDAIDQRRNYQNNSFLGALSNSTKLSSYNGAAIGRYTTGYHDVNAAEVIIYSNALNDAQLKIVYQYLNQKYNITIFNDLFDPIAAYNYGIVGIGEESNGEQSETNTAGLYLTATSGLNVGDYIFVSHNNLANNSSNFRTGTEVTNAGADSAYNRLWYIKPVGTPEAQLAFDFDEALSDGLNPTNISNYVLLYRLGTSGDFTIVKNADGVKNGDQVYFNLTSAEINEGYYTLGTEDAENSPLEGVAGRTWYTLISGNWGDWEIWTLDPSGALPNNPDSLTPNNSPTAAADKVVIKTGRTVVVDTINNLTHDVITIEGRLDLTTSTDHSFGEIKGTGRVLLAADNFPSGDASHFYTEGQGEGTVEYYGGTYNLTTTREFYDVEIELNNTADTVRLLNDYSINGNLTITQGNLKINDTTDDQIINLSVNGNVLVESNGGIFVGTGNPFATDNYQIGGTMPADDGKEYHDVFHQFNMAGNFTNRGTVRFTNLSAPDYDSFATDGAVTVRFTGASNNTVDLYNTTDFYNLIVDKGADKTYKVNLYSDNVNYFKLFGANSVGRTTDAPFSAEDPQVRKALFIHHGTLQLRGNINIPTLSEGADEGGNGDYAVGKNARFWMDGSNVTVYSTASDNSTSGNTQVDDASGASVTPGSSNQAMSVYGEFKITNGFFGTRNSAGFIFWAAGNPQVKIEGGTSNVSQFRAAGSGGVASYVQTGGTLIVRGNETEAGEVSGDPLFEIQDASGIFNMSGGDIIFYDIGGSATNGMYVPSTEGNYNVTGGKVTVEVASGNNFEIGMNAPVWDFEIKRLSGTGTTLVRLTNDFKILGDLTINANTQLDVQDDADATNYDLYVGGNFLLDDGGEYNARTNTTYFIGDSRSYVQVNNTANAGELQFNDVIINKDQRWNTSLFHRVEVYSPGRNSDVHPLEILGDLTIQRGEFDVDEWEVDVKGNIEIVDGQIISSETTKPVGWIVLNGSAQQTIKGATIKEQEFGSFELDNTNGLKLLSDVNVTNFILTPNLGNALVDLDTYNMVVSGDITLTSGAYGNSVMFQTAGNSSDGGITRYIDLSVGVADTEYLFPFGTASVYNPAKVIQSAAIADAGRITINPVNNDHPSSTVPTKTIPYYWVVDTTDFTSVTYDQLKYTFTYNGGSIPGSASKLLNQWSVDYQFYEHNKNITGSNINFPYAAYLTGDYTVGNHSDFKDPVIYYSTTVNYGNDTDFNNNDRWTDQTRWSTVGHYSATNTGTYPQDGDIAILGFGLSSSTATTDDGQRSHWFYVNADITAAKLIFAEEVINADGIAVPRSTSYMPQLIIEADNNIDVNIAIVSGVGTFNVEIECSTCSADPAVTVPRIANINADFGDFSDNLISRFDYELSISNNIAVYLPTSFPDVYPNVHVKGGNGTNRALIFQEDILIKNDLTIRQNAVLRLSSTLNGDIEVLGDLDFTINTGNDKLQFPTTGYERTFTVYGDIYMLDSGTDEITVLNTTPSGLEHTFRLGGSIDQQAGNNIDLFSDNTGGNNVILELFGENDGTYTTDDNPAEFYRIVMNKSGVGTPGFQFSDAFTLEGPTNGDIKALELISGTLNLNDAGININLTTGGTDFKIPAEASLLASNATLNVSGNNTGIWLDGYMRIGWGSKWYLNGGTNNYIEYTSSGNSEIAVYQGELYVGSQIRRSATTEEGILNFRQEHLNSTVVIGTNADLGGEPDRGILELVNTGSQFTQVVGAKITIANSVPSATAPSLYINLADSEVSLADASVIAFGSSDTEASQSLSVYSSVALKNIEVDNTSFNDPELFLHTVALSLDTLTIGADASFDGNGLNLNLYGDFVNNGTFTASQNNTYFLGSVAQQITGTTTFYNLYKTSSNQLILNSDIDVDNELELDAGSFNDGDNTLSVQGNVNMDITHTWGGTSNGILMNGSTEQVLTGNGTFGKLSVRNSSGVSIPQGNVFTITGELQLERGVLDIGKNLLVLNENAIISDENPFSETNMIQTNISFTDAGIKKLFPAIIPADNYSFIYPIGSEGKYTPIELEIDDIDEGGAIRVKAANEMHPTITNDTEPCNELDDVLNVLKYHWVMEATSVSGFNADVSMQYYAADYQLNSAFYDITDYIAARLLFGSILWNKYDQASFDELSNKLRFNFTNADDNGISGDYTAGVEDQTGSCEGAIPDEVPAYITTQNGNWTDETIWDTYPVSGGTVPSGGPRGAIAIVIDTVTIPSNYILSYKTSITIPGMVKVGSTFGHRLGIVDGTGTLQLERGNLPAGVYDDFFGRTGGTIEFTGSDNYDVLSEVNNVRNIIFSGTGERRLPNLDFEVYGEFTIDGSDGNLWVINEHDRDMTLDSSVVFNQGKFDSGVDPSTVTFGGTDQQVISGSGSFTASNAFNNVIMNNSSGLLLSSPKEIDGTLTFTSGIITTDATNILTVDNDLSTAITGYNSSNYVDGPLRKLVQSGDNFIFPIGDNSRYGQLVLTTATATSADYWEVEYYDANPHPTYDTSSYASPLTMVSGNEYWRVKGPEATSTSRVTIRWDNQSVLPAMTDDRANGLHIAQWITGTPDQWQNVGDVLTNVSVNEGTLRTTAAITLQEHYFTVASEESAPLSTATFTSNDTIICDDGSSTATLEIAFTGVAPWTVTISEGGDSQVLPATSSNPYTFTVDTAGTYTISSFTDGNSNPGVVFGPDVTVTVIPLPNQYNVTGGGTICAGDTPGIAIGIDNSDVGVNYELLANGTSTGIWAGTGSAIDFGDFSPAVNTNYTVEATDASGTCNQLMNGTASVTVNPIPTANITVAIDTICNGDFPLINIDFTTVATDWDLVIDDGTNPVENINVLAADDPYDYTPAVNPAWVNDGTPDTDYIYSIEITDSNGCVNTYNSPTITVFKVPETGPQYHISNDFGN